MTSPIRCRFLLFPAFALGFSFVLVPLSAGRMLDGALAGEEGAAGM